MANTTFPWITIKQDIERPDNSPIGHLIDYVLESKLSESLHAATMLRNLRIGRSKNFSKNDGELTIESYLNITNQSFQSHGKRPAKAVKLYLNLTMLFQRDSAG